MITGTEQHPIIKEFIALGEKYTQEVSRLENENEELREQLLDLMAYHKSRDEESFPADITRRLVNRESPLKVFREYRGLSQKELSEKSGVPQSTISNIENGTRRGTVDNFKALAEVLDLDIDDLV